MESDFWLKKWQDNEIRFHQAKYHSMLEKFGDKFSPGTILVPLCGKSLDMLFLSSMGHSVIGVELSSIACRDFFVENGLSFTERIESDFIIFESEDITLWCGDFFRLPQEVWSTVTGVYDRAALIALPPQMREAYVAEMNNRSSSRLEILLITIEYPEGSLKGPPFSVPKDEVIRMYERFNSQTLHAQNEKRQEVDIQEICYWMTKTIP